MNLTRASFLRLWVTLCLLVGHSAAQEPTAPARPRNVLFLFADDLRTDAVHAFGGEHAKTPELDRLAARGMRFRANHCMGSRHGAVCAPSRAMLMTGRYLTHVPDDMGDATTFPAVFGAAGYTTFATGKWHNGRPSFARSFQTGHAEFFGGMADHNAVPIVDFDKGVFGKERKGEKHSSELFADAVIGFLEQHHDEAPDKPFLCYAAFTAPHDPRDAPPDYRAAALADRPPLPPNFRPQHGWNIGKDALLVRDEQLAAWPRDPEVIRDQLAEYYALVTHLDAQIGRVLATLERLGYAKDTIVVFTADHGLALGSHGLLGKQSLYEHSMSCPLVIAIPGGPEGDSVSLTYLLDLFPTLCGLCGLTVPAGVDGKDLAPILRDPHAKVRDDLFTLYRDNQRALRDGRYKLMRFTQTGKTLLFDLQSDPHEIHDLSEDPAQRGRIAALLARIKTWQELCGDAQPLVPDDPLPLTIDLSGHERKPDQWQPAWIRAKYFGEHEDGKK
ncbi:MAG: sulfatase-like hydrolase/transferase [Planctomycetota bacterium]